MKRCENCNILFNDYTGKMKYCSRACSTSATGNVLKKKYDALKLELDRVKADKARLVEALGDMLYAVSEMQNNELGANDLLYENIKDAKQLLQEVQNG